MSDFFSSLEDRRAEVERHRENSARLAFVNAKVETTGQGSIEIDERIDFGMTFTQEPFLSLGFELDLDDLDESQNRELKSETPPLPMVVGYVTTWDRDDRGFWIGAWYAARVWYPPTDLIPVTSKFTVQHHLTFSGIAMKDVPIDGLGN